MICFLFILISCSSSETGQEYAYFLIFENLFERSAAGQIEQYKNWVQSLDISVRPMHDRTYYIGVDLENAKLEDTAPLIILFQDFCDDNGFLLLLDNYDGLTEKGYFHWENILYLFVFEDEKLTEDILITSAHGGGWRIDYTVELINNVWEITKTSNFRYGSLNK